MAHCLTEEIFCRFSRDVCDGNCHGVFYRFRCHAKESAQASSAFYVKPEVLMYTIVEKSHSFHTFCRWHYTVHNVACKPRLLSHYFRAMMVYEPALHCRNVVNVVDVMDDQCFVHYCHCEYLHKNIKCVVCYNSQKF